MIAPSFLEVTEPTDRLIVVNTFSKNWCMTGWRIGWLIFPRGMSKVFDNLSQYNTTSVTTFVQHAAIAALDRGDEFIRDLPQRYDTMIEEGVPSLVGFRWEPNSPDERIYVPPSGIIGLKLGNLPATGMDTAIKIVFKEIG